MSLFSVRVVPVAVKAWPAATLTVPSASALASVIWVAPPVRETAPWKSLAEASVIAPAPALTLLVPATISAPDCETAPPLLVAARLPPTLPWPRPSAPLEVAVSAPVASAPSVSALASVIWVAPPVRETAPWKSLPEASVIAPAPALTLLVPATISAPDCETAPPLLVAVRLPPTLPWPRPSAPLEVAVSAPVASAPSVSALASVIWVAPPVRETAPWKSLAEASVIAPAPALTLLVPATISAPDCETAPPLLVAVRLPPTLPWPRPSAPAGGGRQCTGGQRAQRERVGIGDLGGAAGEGDRTLEVVARGQRDRAGTGVDVARARDDQRAGLRDRTAVAGGREVAADAALAEAERAAGGGRQRAGGQRAQRERVGIGDLGGAAGEGDRTLEVVARGQRDRAGTGVDVARARDDQRAGLRDRTAVAGGREVAADAALAEAERAAGGGRQRAGGQRAQRERVGIGDLGGAAGEGDRTLEVVGRGQCDVVRAGVDGRRAADCQRTGLRQVRNGGHGQVARDREAGQHADARGAHVVRAAGAGLNLDRGRRAAGEQRVDARVDHHAADRQGRSGCGGQGRRPAQRGAGADAVGATACQRHDIERQVVRIDDRHTAGPGRVQRQRAEVIAAVRRGDVAQGRQTQRGGRRHGTGVGLVAVGDDRAGERGRSAGVDDVAVEVEGNVAADAVRPGAGIQVADTLEDLRAVDGDLVVGRDRERLTGVAAQQCGVQAVADRRGDVRDRARDADPGDRARTLVEDDRRARLLAQVERVGPAAAVDAAAQRAGVLDRERVVAVAAGEVAHAGEGRRVGPIEKAAAVGAPDRERGPGRRADQCRPRAIAGDGVGARGGEHRDGARERACADRIGARAAAQRRCLEARDRDGREPAAGDRRVGQRDGRDVVGHCERVGGAVAGESRHPAEDHAPGRAREVAAEREGLSCARADQLGVRAIADQRTDVAEPGHDARAVVRDAAGLVDDQRPGGLGAEVEAVAAGAPVDRAAQDRGDRGREYEVVRAAAAGEVGDVGEGRARVQRAAVRRGDREGVGAVRRAQCVAPPAAVDRRAERGHAAAEREGVVARAADKRVDRGRADTGHRHRVRTVERETRAGGGTRQCVGARAAGQGADPAERGRPVDGPGVGAGHRDRVAAVGQGQRVGSAAAVDRTVERRHAGAEGERVVAGAADQGFDAGGADARDGDGVGAADREGRAARGAGHGVRSAPAAQGRDAAERGAAVQRTGVGRGQCDRVRAVGEDERIRAATARQCSAEGRHAAAERERVGATAAVDRGDCAEGGAGVHRARVRARHGDRVRAVGQGQRVGAAAAGDLAIEARHACAEREGVVATASDQGFDAGGADARDRDCIRVRDREGRPGGGADDRVGTAAAGEYGDAAERRAAIERAGIRAAERDRVGAVGQRQRVAATPAGERAGERTHAAGRA